METQGARGWGPDLAAEARAPAVAVALVLAAWWCNRWSDTDLRVEAWFFDAAAGAFRWRSHWLAETVLHDGARWLSMALALSLVALALWSGRRRASAPTRSAAAFAVVSGLLAALAVSWLKHRSAHSCPWSLQLYGGAFDFFRLGMPLPAHPGPGGCLPSGHASTGFMWLGLFAAARRWPDAAFASRPGWRPAFIAFAVATSAAQVVRGAHFLSHVLLAVAVCVAVVWGCERALSLGRWVARPVTLGAATRSG